MASVDAFNAPRIRRALVAIGGLLLLAGACFFTPAAEASSTNAGNVERVLILSSGIVTFNLTGGRTALPSCQGPTVPTRWAFNSSTTAGQSMLSLILTAYAANKQISVVGTGTCTDWSDTESVSLIVTEN
jgi:hypothetical protein